MMITKAVVTDHTFYYSRKIVQIGTVTHNMHTKCKGVIHLYTFIYRAKSLTFCCYLELTHNFDSCVSTRSTPLKKG
jgi:hypothetical protein